MSTTELILFSFDACKCHKQIVLIIATFRLTFLLNCVKIICTMSSIAYAFAIFYRFLLHLFFTELQINATKSNMMKPNETEVIVMAFEVIKNNIHLSTIQKEIKGGSKQVDFLISVFPSFLNDSSLGILYFIFNDNGEKPASSVKRTMSDFMNGNYNKKGLTKRKQNKALDYIATRIREKQNVPNWIKHLEKNHPNLSLETMQNIANIDMDLFPNRFKSLIINEHNKYYLLLFLICWAVFGERIEECNFQESSFYIESKSKDSYNSDDDFFATMFTYASAIQQIDMAYHSGYKWLYSTERSNMLNNFLIHGGRLRVLVNSQKAASIIAKHTNNPNKEYIGFKKSIEAWKRLAHKFPDSVEFIVSDIPLMHSFIHFKFREQEASKMLIIFYTYGNSAMPKNYHLLVSSSSDDYSLFNQEFEYLISQYKKS